MMRRAEMIAEADSLLQRWEYYSVGNRRYIEAMFDGSNMVDMMLNIDVMSRQTRLFIKERGVDVWEYRTSYNEAVVYVILLDIIEIIAERVMEEQYMDGSGHLLLSEDVNESRKRLMDEAFSVMGEPYYGWHKEGVTIWNMEKFFN